MTHLVMDIQETLDRIREAMPGCLLSYSFGLVDPYADRPYVLNYTVRYIALERGEIEIEKVLSFSALLGQDAIKQIVDTEVTRTIEDFMKMTDRKRFM